MRGNVKALLGSKKTPCSFDCAQQKSGMAGRSSWMSSQSSDSPASSNAGENKQERATRVPVMGDLVVFDCAKRSAQQREMGRHLSGMRRMLGMRGAERKEEGDRLALSLDHILKQYNNYCSDFGPLSIACIDRFAKLMAEAFEVQKAEGKQIILLSDGDDEARTNAACLIACWLILERGYSAEEAWAPFKAAHREAPFVHFKEASYIHESAQFPLYVTDVLEGVAKAKEHGLLSLKGFDVEKYNMLDNPRVANMNTIAPGLFVAFTGPKDEACMSQPRSLCEHTPEEYFGIFQEEGVTDVVRLNDSQYDETAFVRAGFAHHDIVFDDCSNPTASVLKQWFEVCAERKGAVAVHCKAGLGRTGVLIAAWLMRKYRFSGRQVIGFIRIMRPGSILGPQQDFLVDNESLFWAMGDPDLYDETVMYKDCEPVLRVRAAPKPKLAETCSTWAASSEGPLSMSDSVLSELDTFKTTSSRTSLVAHTEHDQALGLHMDGMDEVLAGGSFDSDGWGDSIEEALRVLRARENTMAMERRAEQIVAKEAAQQAPQKGLFGKKVAA